MKTNFFTGTMWRKLTFWLSVAAVVLPSLGVAAYAQETGQIAGTVTDPTGAATTFIYSTCLLQAVVDPLEPLQAKKVLESLCKRVCEGAW